MASGCVAAKSRNCLTFDMVSSVGFACCVAIEPRVVNIVLSTHLAC